MAFALAQQRFVAALAALRCAEFAGCRLLQQLSIFSPAHLHPHQCHLGRFQCAGVHAGHGRLVVQAAHHTKAIAGSGHVYRWCAVRTWAWRLANLAAGGIGDWRCVCVDRSAVLGALQLVALAAQRPARDSQQLGEFFDGANGVWSAVVRHLHRLGMALHQQPSY